MYYNGFFFVWFFESIFDVNINRILDDDVEFVDDVSEIKIKNFKIIC